MIYAKLKYFDGHTEDYCFQNWDQYNAATFSPTVEVLAVLELKASGKTYAERQASAIQLALDFQAAEGDAGLDDLGLERPVWAAERHTGEDAMRLPGESAQEFARLVKVARLAVDAPVEPYDRIRRHYRGIWMERTASLQLARRVYKDGAPRSMRNGYLVRLCRLDRESPAKVCEDLRAARRLRGEDRLHCAISPSVSLWSTVMKCSVYPGTIFPPLIMTAVPFAPPGSDGCVAT